MLNAYNKLRYTFYTLFNHFWLTRLVNRLLYIYTDSIFLLRYHCNASGDFALLDRESWLMMGGYREDTWISTHTDSIHVMEAVTLGCHTRVLPYPIFHQAHERRYDFSEANPDMELMYQRLLSQAKQMQKSGNIAQKKPDWGLKSNILKEVCPK
jgi:hypothetical protein